MSKVKHIIFYSGGLGSWMTANKVIQKYGKENVVLLFTDTLMEDEDLYRFLDETEKDFGVDITRIADGRDVWEVFRDVRFIGNSRVAQCSHKLKQDKAAEWLEGNYASNECVLYLGIDWTEQHRKKSPIENWSPYQVEFPLCEKPYINKIDIIKELEGRGINIPRLYNMNFSHNNCGGFCVRGGQGHFVNLLKQMPERYKYHEKKEQEMRSYLNRDDISILTRQRNGKKEPLTLKQLREEYESGSQQIDLFDIGGCGCFVS
ncbi:hypothetical protein [Virgibacillus sp. Bac332]|uniref:hypothetical protein n=1 Tax=Virgibacillus sp. Bac332 TaxID=2419842 RepID=UPI000EF4B28F|nr:hypothetical protein [Virgibacillus sp. Bac332]